MAEQNEQSPAKAVRHSITLGPATERRLNEFIKNGGHIVLSQVADRAVNGFIAESEKPERTRLLERLRTQNAGMGGRYYAMGRTEGDRWARTTATWPDICAFSSELHGPSGVLVEKNIYSGRYLLEFKGWFSPPVEYPRDSFSDTGAPGFKDDEHQVWVSEPAVCEVYWRGWLAGVDQIFKEFREDLGWPAEVPTAADRSKAQQAEWEAEMAEAEADREY